jgi:hypothetical protein
MAEYWRECLASIGKGLPSMTCMPLKNGRHSSGWCSCTGMSSTTPTWNTSLKRHSQPQKRKHIFYCARHWAHAVPCKQNWHTYTPPAEKNKKSAIPQCSITYSVTHSRPVAHDTTRGAKYCHIQTRRTVAHLESCFANLVKLVTHSMDAKFIG